MLLHTSDTPNFPTMLIIEKLLSRLSSTLFCITEHESANFGILLREIWVRISSWNQDKSKYESIAASKEGFKGVSFEQYKTAYRVWHRSFAGVVLSCVGSNGTCVLHFRLWQGAVEGRGCRTPRG